MQGRFSADAWALKPTPNANLGAPSYNTPALEAFVGPVHGVSPLESETSSQSSSVTRPLNVTVHRYIQCCRCNPREKTEPRSHCLLCAYLAAVTAPRVPKGGRDARHGDPRHGAAIPAHQRQDAFAVDVHGGLRQLARYQAEFGPAEEPPAAGDRGE